jgi:hypothetical protein
LVLKLRYPSHACCLLPPASLSLISPPTSTWKAEGLVAGIKAFGAESEGIPLLLPYLYSLSPLFLLPLPLHSLPFTPEIAEFFWLTDP